MKTQINREELIIELDNLDQTIKNLDFISPNHLRRVNEINSPLMTDSNYDKIQFVPSKGLESIIFLEQFAKRRWCVENVISYYKSLIPCQVIGRHQIWANFKIPKIEMPKNEIRSMDKGWNTAWKILLSERNKANSKLGLHILDCAKGIYVQKSFEVGSIFYSN